MTIADMGFWQFLNDNSVFIFVFFIFFGGGIATFFRALFMKAADTKVKIEKSKERQLELEVERLRLLSHPVSKKKNVVEPKDDYSEGYKGMEILMYQQEEN